ncbi:MAG: universal stress protein [Acidimicrobiia bacterium]|nr:universal stress protein [Acidimicrobiia bacterium]
MDGLEPLIVGVDGSGAAATALDWALERTAGEMPLHVVHGRKPPGDLAFDLFHSGDDMSEHEAREALEGPWTEAARKRDRRIATHLVADDPADALLAVAAEVGARAVVVGVHGSGGKRYGLGSVTRKLLHRSSLPLVIAKPAQFRAVPGQRKPVVAYVGYGDATEDAARWASEFAAAVDLPLLLVHVVGYRPMFPADSPSDTLASYLGGDVSRDWAQADLNRLKEELVERSPGLSVDTKVEVGFAVRAIEEGSRSAELVVLGKRHGSSLARHTISPRIQQSIVRSATTTVVVPTCSTSQ